MAAADPLLKAIQSNDFFSVEELLKAGYSAFGDWDEMKPLDLAIVTENLPIARVLIEHGAHVVPPIVCFNATALQCATIALQSDIMIELVEQGVDWNTRDASGATLLHMLFEMDKSSWIDGVQAARPSQDLIIGMLSMLLNLGVDVNARTASGKTVLHLALEQDLHRVAEFLLAEQHRQLVALDLLDNRGNSPLGILIERQLFDNDTSPLLELFLTKGARVQVHDIFRQSVACKRLDVLKLLLKHVDVRYIDAENGQTWLHVLLDAMAASPTAADDRGFQASAMREISRNVQLKAGESVNLVDSCDRTPLHMAISLGMAELAESMAKYFSNVHARNVNEQTIMHALTSQCRDSLGKPIAQYAKIVETLLAKRADIYDKDRHDMSPLEYAVKNQHLAILQVLQKHGADFKLRSIEGDSLLHLLNASSCDDQHQHEIVGMLTRAAAAACDVNSKNNAGIAPLHAAILNRNWRLARSLVAHGADVNCRIGNSLETPLHLAARVADQADIVTILIDAGAEIQARNAKSHTALQLSLIGGHSEVSKCLIGLGGAGDARDRFGEQQWSLLHLAAAAHEDDREIVELLVLAGAQLDARCALKGWSPLHLAVEQGHARVARALIELGADVNERSNQQRIAPLHLAVQEQHLELVELLIERKALLNAKTRLGKTPLHFGTCSLDRSTRGNIVEILLHWGAHSEVYDASGCTPLYNVCKYRSDDCLIFLLQHGADVNDASFFEIVGENIRPDLRMREWLMDHLFKLRAAGLPIAKYWNFWFADYASFARLPYAHYSKQVKQMRKFFVADNMSVYDMLCLDVPRKYTCIRKIKIDLLEVLAKFPLYYGLAKKKYREACERKPLVARARLQFRRLIHKMPLPDLCIHHIFTFLSNSALESIIETAQH